MAACRIRWIFVFQGGKSSTAFFPIWIQLIAFAAARFTPSCNPKQGKKDLEDVHGEVQSEEVIAVTKGETR
jgi:hypothetical protein